MEGSGPVAAGPELLQKSYGRTTYKKMEEHEDVCPMNSYRGVMKSGRAEIVIKGSRFVGTAMRAASEAGALRKVEKISSKYEDATHNVYAFAVGLDLVVERCSDDGEPSGTAGKPTLEALKRRDILNSLVVVTRYFGGTKLGAGGLIRAYGKAAGEALEAAKIKRWERHRRAEISLSYSNHGPVRNYLLKNDFPLIAEEFTEIVVLTVLVPVSNWQHTLNVIDDITQAEATVEWGQEHFLPLN